MVKFYEGCRLCSLRRRRICPEECFECSEPTVIRQGFVHSLGPYYARVQAEHWTSEWTQAIVRAKRGYQPVMSSFGRIVTWYIKKHLSDLGPCLVANVPGFPVYPERLIQGRMAYVPGLIVQTGAKEIMQHRCKTDAQRRRNVAGLYTVLDPGKVRGRNVILLDDVVTSGATLSECAGVLCEAGADMVVGLTLGKTDRKTVVRRTIFELG